MNEVYKKTEKILTENFKHTVDLRRKFHRHPETEFEEFETAKIILKELDRLNIKYESGIAKTGIKAYIKGSAQKSGEKKCVLLRADMDALCVCEKTRASYKSENEGKMHACGHDAHMAILLSVMCALNEIKDKLNCDIVGIFQPAEEGAGGAKPMIDAGVTENPKADIAFGLHVEPTFETGSIAIGNGGVMASPDEFDITVTGKGGHGGYREKCHDPIYAAAKIVSSLIDEGSALCEKESECVISIGEISGGNFYNIIPDSVEIKGTSRAVDYKKRSILAERIKEISENTAKEYGCKTDVDFRFMYPPLVNNKYAADIFRAAAKDINIKITEQQKPFMGGDDFAYFAEKIPAAYCFLGCRNEQKGCVHPWHSNMFNIDEDCLLTGGRILCRAVIEYAEGEKKL